MLCRNRVLATARGKAGPGPRIKPVRIERGLARQLAEVPEYIGRRVGSGRRPLNFSVAAPEPVSDGNLHTVSLDARAVRSFSSPGATDDADGRVADSVGDVTSSTMADVLHAPVAKLDPARMGMPAFLVRRLAELGVTHLTPVQAKLFQEAYAVHDAAVCGPTGTGKSFGLAVAVVARLLRDGPMLPCSTVVLAPTPVLVRQMDAWIRQLWRFDDDPFLSVAAVDPVADPHRLVDVYLNPPRSQREFAAEVAARTPLEASQLRRDTQIEAAARRAAAAASSTPAAADADPLFKDRRPYIIVATPEVMWAAYELQLARKVSSVSRRRSVASIRVLPNVGAVFVDEVDAVLPASDREAPGNRLLNDMLTRNKFEAPPQILVASATLAPSMVNHVRHFMQARNHGFVFEAEEAAAAGGTSGGLSSNNTNRTAAAKASAKQHGERLPSDGASEQRRLRCPPTVTHRFHVAESPAQRAAAIAAEVQRVVDAAELAEMQADPLAATAAPSVGVSVRGVVVVEDDEAVAGFVSDVLPRVRIAGTAVRAGPFPGQRAVGESVWDSLPASAEFQEGHSREGSLCPDVRFVVMGAEATRGVDLPGATHVFVAMRPSSALDYVHFAGRVGRMGARGVAVSLMRRGDVRHINDFCEAVGVDFRVERRKFAQVDAMQGHYGERTS